MVEQMRGKRMPQDVRGQLFAVDSSQHSIVFDTMPEGLTSHLLRPLAGKQHIY